MQYFENYCTECEWGASTEEYDSRVEIGEAAIAHHVESGHVIDSRSFTYTHPIESEPEF